MYKRGERMELTKGQKVYYARILEPVGVFEVIEVKLRTVEDMWFAGIENRTKHAYLFSNKDINKNVFFDRDEALDIVKAAEENCKKTFSKETYYEEY